MAASVRKARRARKAPHTGLPARETLRLNGYASIAAGLALLVGAVPIARGAGIERPALLAIAGLFFTIYGLDALGSALARKLRRVNVLPFAVFDAICAAGILVLLSSSAEALTFLGRFLFVGGSATLGWFALAEFRAARTL